MGEHGLVEIDAAEPLDPLGRPEDLEALGGLSQHGGVEGAAAEIEDADDRAGLDALLRGVVDRCCLGLGERHDVVEVGHADGLRQEVLLVGAPVGRVRDGDP